jgi:hypothetical protein
VRERARDVKLIGVFWTDLPQWSVQIARQQRGLDWVSFMRALPPSAAGREALERWVGHGRAEADFLGQIAARLYADSAAALGRHAPEVLSLGDVYWASDMPGNVLREAMKHVDVISVQFGPEHSPHPGPGYERHFDSAFFGRLHQLTGKPLIIADHAVSFPDARHARTLWHQAASQEEAAHAYREFVVAAARTPYILGYCRCQYASFYSAWRDTLKQGLLDVDGTPYEPYCTLVAEANREAQAVFAERTGVSRGNR